MDYEKKKLWWAVCIQGQWMEERDRKNNRKEMKNFRIFFCYEKRKMKSNFCAFYVSLDQLVLNVSIGLLIQFWDGLELWKLDL